MSEPLSMEVFTKSISELTNAFNTRLDSMEKVYSGALSAAVKDIDDKFDNINSTINNKFDTINDSIKNINIRCDNMENGVNTRFADVQKDTNDKINLLNEKFDSKIDTIRDNLNNSVRELNNAIETRVQTLSSTLQAALNNIERVEGVIDEKFAEEIPFQISSEIRPEIDHFRTDMDSLYLRILKVEKVATRNYEKRLEEASNNVELMQKLNNDLAQVQQQQVETNEAVVNMLSNVKRLEATLAGHSVENVPKEVKPSKNLKKTKSPDDTIDWIHNTTMNSSEADKFSMLKDETAVHDESDSDNRSEYTKMTGKKSSIDPPDVKDGGSSPSSSNSSSKSDFSDSDSEESDSDILDLDQSTHKKKVDRLLDPKEFKSESRRSSIVSNGHTSRSKDKKKYGTQPVVCIQPPPTTDGMYLEKVKVGRVLAFCKKFNAEAAKFMGGLKISNYISERVQSQMKMVAEKYDMPGKKGILKNGTQRISNKEAYAILAVMCAPKNLEEMQRKLLKSSWAPNTKHDYTNLEVVNKNIGDFKADVLIYIDRFNDKLKLLTYLKKSREFMPTTLFKKGGSMGNPGLADYFIGGLPDKDFGARVWMSVDETDRQKCKEWKAFTKLYVKALGKMEKRKQNEDVNKHIYLGAKKMVKVEEEEAISVKKNKASLHKGQRLHMLEYDEDSTSEGEPFDSPDVKAENDEDSLSAIAREDDEMEEDSLDGPGGSFFNAVANLFQPKEEGAKGVCFKMVDHGKCDRPDCPWSHKEEDIAKARRLKELKLKEGKFQGSKGMTPAKQVTFSRGSGPYPKKS